MTRSYHLPTRVQLQASSVAVERYRIPNRIASHRPSIRLLGRLLLLGHCCLPPHWKVNAEPHYHHHLSLHTGKKTSFGT